MLTGIQKSRLQWSFFSHYMIHTLASVNLSCLVWSEAVCHPLTSQKAWAGRQTSSEGDLETESLWWEKRSVQMPLLLVIFANYKAIDCYSQSLPVWRSLITNDNFLAFSELSLKRTHTRHLHPTPTSALTKWISTLFSTSSLALSNFLR